MGYEVGADDERTSGRARIADRLLRVTISPRASCAHVWVLGRLFKGYYKGSKYILHGHMDFTFVAISVDQGAALELCS